MLPFLFKCIKRKNKSKNLNFYVIHLCFGVIIFETSHAFFHICLWLKNLNLPFLLNVTFLNTPTITRILLAQMCKLRSSSAMICVTKDIVTNHWLSSTIEKCIYDHLYSSLKIYSFYKKRAIQCILVCRYP